MCAIDWEALSEWITSLATLATAVIAAIALTTWRSQLRGTSKYLAAQKVIEEARLLRYFFYDARNPLILATEFPPDYYTVAGQRTSTEEAFGYAHVYNERYKLVGRQILVLARLRARAGAVLGDGVATAIEELARKARELQNFMGEMVTQIRTGEHIVKQWPDQQWVARVKSSVTASPDGKRDDPFSQEFEQKLRNLETLLKPWM